MRLPVPAKTHCPRTEQIILFRVSGQLFAVSSASVQEVRALDSLSAAAREVAETTVRKVQHMVWRGDKSLYVINAAMHFGLPPATPALVFVLRRTRTALLIDGIKEVTTMTRLQALPRAFCHEERAWYRGLTTLDQAVIPVVEPEGFLTAEEIALLDASLLSHGPENTAGQSGKEPSEDTAI
jgi:chemotaxis signal transduction protein